MYNNGLTSEDARFKTHSSPGTPGYDFEMGARKP